MGKIVWRSRSAGETRPQRRWCGLGLAVVTMASAGLTGAAQADSSKLGVYSGTVIVSGTEIGQENVTYRASVKISMPLTDRSDSSAVAELGDIDKPSTMATVRQWDLAGKSASPDSDGKITTWTCSIATLTEIPMNAQGTLNVNYSAKTHSMYIAHRCDETSALQLYQFTVWRV